MNFPDILRHREDAIPFATKDTSIIREIVHPTHSSAKNQSLAEATLLPGAQSQAHFHPASEEIYYILRGRGIVALLFKPSASTCRYECEAGTAIVIPPGVPHQIRNLGAEDLVFVCCCSPAYSHDDTTICDDLM